MGSSHRLAAIAAASHARHYYNHTQQQSDVLQTEVPQYSVNVLFVSATLCGVLVAVCAACWKRSVDDDKPDDDFGGVYTISTDHMLRQVQDESAGPPPAYDTVVNDPTVPKDYSLQEVVTEGCPRCTPKPDSGLPSYEAALLLKDTKL